MLNLFIAEWQKVARNRWVSGAMIWVFPIGSALFAVLLIGVGLISEEVRNNIVNPGSSTSWTETMSLGWTVVNNDVGRLILLGFTATIFAGEYRNRTWKNLIPRRGRVSLIGMKFTVLGVYVLIAFMLMGIIWTIGYTVIFAIEGTNFGGLDGATIGNFLGEYGVQASAAFTSIMVMAGIAAIAAFITRSTFGAIIAGFIFTVLEQGMIVFVFLASDFFEMPSLLNVYRIMPTYNFNNITSWMLFDRPMNPYAGSEFFTPSALPLSLAIVGIWVVMLLSIALLIFTNQDITD